MTTPDETPDDLALGLPVLVIVDADGEACVAVEVALRRRFGADYHVLTADSARSGLDVLTQLARHGDAVALIATDLHLPEMDGVAFLEQAHTVHRCAMRALLVGMDQRGTRIPFGSLHALQRATALGRIDFWVLKG
jgi:thioredoxin reductase (NADPH)